MFTPFKPSPTVKRKLLCWELSIPAGNLGSARLIKLLTCCKVRPVAASLIGSILTLISSCGAPYTRTSSVPLTFRSLSVSSWAKRAVSVIGVFSKWSARTDSNKVNAVAPRFSSKTGAIAPSGNDSAAAPMASRISLNNCSLLELFIQSCVSMRIMEIPARDVDFTSFISNISLSLSSSTSLTKASTRSADAPGY